jgi:hypothetical protein
LIPNEFIAAKAATVFCGTALTLDTNLISGLRSIRRLAEKSTFDPQIVEDSTPRSYVFISPKLFEKVKARHTAEPAHRH